MYAINYIKNFFWLVAVLVSACQATSVEHLSKHFPSPSSPNSAVNSSLPKTQPTAVMPHPIFREILPVLKTQTSLPIRLPAYIPETDGHNPIYALLEIATTSEYRIMLAFTENCTGGNACRLGNIFAEANTSKTPTLTGEAVPLANGITGYFTDATCGANCSDSTLVWEQNNVRYTVAIKAGKVATLVKVTNSAIAISPIPSLGAQFTIESNSLSVR